jgi:RNase P subunit RPR2
MTDIKLDSALCSTCGQPLFLDKKECRDFIKRRLKEGYMVCQCCGAKQKIEVDRALTDSG